MAIPSRSPILDRIRGADITGHDMQMWQKAQALPLAAFVCAYLFVAAVVWFLITGEGARRLAVETAVTCSMGATSALPYNGVAGRKVSVHLIGVDGHRLPEMRVDVKGRDGSTTEDWPTASEACRLLQSKPGAGFWLWLRAALACGLGAVAGWYARRPILAYFDKRGAEIAADHFIRGARIGTVAEVTAQVNQSHRKAGDYHFGGVPIERGLEMLNFMATGSQGVGKSVLIKALAILIRKNRRRMVVYDVTSEFTELLYRDGTDVVLNPFDARCPQWNLFKECRLEGHFKMIAEALIQDDGSPNAKFFIQAAQQVFVDVCIALQQRGQTTTQQLYEAIALTSNQQLFELLAGRAGQVHINPEGSNQTQGVRSTISQGVEILRYIPTSGPEFSVREWVENEDGDSCLFLNSRSDLQGAVVTLFAVLIEVATVTVMSMPPTRKDRLWMLLDELASIRKVPSLKNALTQSRKFGLVCVVGFQNESQLVEIYGKEVTQTILANLQHCSAMRVADGATAELLSKRLANQEIYETSDGISWGVEAMRDGGSITAKRAEIPVVMAAEIQNLPELVMFVKHAGAYPVCKIDLRPERDAPAEQRRFLLDYPVIAPAFVQRPELGLDRLPAAPAVIESGPIPAATSGAPTLEREVGALDDPRNPTENDAPSSRAPGPQSTCHDLEI